jgi:hypothetical protein
MLKLIEIDKFHHIINILTFYYFIKKKELCNVKLFVVDYIKKKKSFVIRSCNDSISCVKK